MAKKRKKSSSSSSRSPRRRDSRVGHQIRVLLLVLVFLFVFLSVFNQAGAWGNTLHTFFRKFIGGATPLLAGYLLWWAGKRLFPSKIEIRFVTFMGTVLFVATLAGFMHSFQVGELTAAAVRGEGGGWLGNFVFSGLNSSLGSIIARIFLTFFMLISLMLIFDRAILPFLHPRTNPDEEDEDEPAPLPVISDAAKAKVVGELGGQAKQGKGFLGFGKPTVIAANPPAAKPAPLSRSINWNYPPITLLKQVDDRPQVGNIQKRMELIQKTLKDFGIDVAMTDVSVGPTVSQYQLKPADGVKLNQITARQDDLALALAAESLRVEAPIPGKSLVGVEIPNDKKAKVGLRDILEDKKQTFQQVGSKLAIALGRDSSGHPSVADLAKMPHVLIAGSTGSGKSVCINTLIVSLLMNNSPDELRMILVDPKRVELSLYNGLPHLLTPVITEPKDTVKALNWAVREMERRYKVLQSTGKRNIAQYNQSPDVTEGPMPFIVVIIDELADLMMVAAREVESKIVRIAQMARAVGIHLVVATQRPSVDVITGLIKANIPTRIAFAVTSQVDSRTIIDGQGAEKLLGYGDMLYLSTELGKPRRVQGVFCTEEEINSVIAFIRQQAPEDRYDPTVLEEQSESRFVSAGGLDDAEEALLREAYELVSRQGKASTSMLQTHMRLGYNKAKRIITAMEERGMIGPERGGKMREVYASLDMNQAGSEEIEPPYQSFPETQKDDAGIAPYPENE